MSFRFGVYELDEAAGELRKAGQSVAVQPKPLALLGFLIRERHRVVPADELLEVLWPGTVVSPGSLTRAVSHARRAIDDTGRSALLRSIPKRGYRFMGEVVEVGVGESADPPARAADSAGEPLEPRRLFVGRADPLSRLGAAGAQLAEGRRAVVLVTGPAGIGKTRLTEVFAAEIAARGPLVITARCDDRDGAPAFWLWAQVLRKLVEEPSLRSEIEGSIGAGELTDLVPGLAGHAEPRTDSVGLASDQQRFLFFDAVTRALHGCARQRPLVLILEDLQWAGSPSLRLLEHLCSDHGGDLTDAPLLIVATIRDESRERGHPVERTIAELRGREQCDAVALGGLSRGDVGRLLAQAIGRPAPADLTSELYARTEGVPFFVGEAIRLLAERGHLKHPERIPRRGVTLPPHAVDLIRRPLDGLSAACADLVGAGAVLGREFALRQLAAIADCSPDTALDLIDEAVRSGVVEESRDRVATYCFAHALFQEAIYEALSPAARARLHQRAAARLERQHEGALDDVIAELAHHHHRSVAVGDPERAYALAMQAAAKAQRQFAFEMAAVHYEQAASALDHCEVTTPGRRLETLLALGEAHRLSGERARRRAVFHEAMERARSMDSPQAFAQAAIGYCEPSEWSPRDEVARAAIEEALSGLAPDDVRERARLTTRLGYIEVENRSTAEPHGREGVRLARESGDPEAIQEAIYVQHYVIAGPDDMDERRAQIGNLVDAARDSRGRDTAVIAVLDIACDALTLGNRDDAIALRAQASELAGRYASPSMSWHIKVFDTGLALLEGRYPEVEQGAHDALLMGRRIQHDFARPCFGGQMFLFARDHGRAESLLDAMRPGLAAQRGARHWVRAVVAREELRAGRESDARVIWDDLADEDFANIPRNIRWPGTMPEIALLCAELDDAPRARGLLDVLETGANLHAVLPVPILYGGPFSRAMARLWETLGVADEALRLYADAIERADALRARPSVARIQLEYGHACLRSGDVGRARELLDDGDRIARSLGLEALAQEIATLRARA